MLSKHRPLNSRQYVKTRSRSLSRCLAYHDHHKCRSLFHFRKSIEKSFRASESIDQKRQSVFFVPHIQNGRRTPMAFFCRFGIGIDVGGIRKGQKKRAGGTFFQPRENPSHSAIRKRQPSGCFFSFGGSCSGRTLRFEREVFFRVRESPAGAAGSAAAGQNCRDCLSGKKCFFSAIDVPAVLWYHEHAEMQIMQGGAPCRKHTSF